jgi:general secretion pathway protein G
VEIRVAEHAGAVLHCALCHERLPKLCARCDECGTRLHFACRAILSRCPTLGCASGPHETLVTAPPSLFRSSNEARKRRIVRQRALGLLGWALAGCLALGLVGAAIPKVEARVARLRAERALLDLHAIASSVDLYRIDTGRFPWILRDLQRPARGVDGWSGPYPEGPLLDPWGNPYVYRHRSGRPYCELLSYGADGVPGGSGACADLRVIQGLD